MFNCNTLVSVASRTLAPQGTAPEAYIVEIYIALCHCEDWEGRQWFLQWDFVGKAKVKSITVLLPQVTTLHSGYCLS